MLTVFLLSAIVCCLLRKGFVTLCMELQFYEKCNVYHRLLNSCLESSWFTEYNPECKNIDDVQNKLI